MAINWKFETAVEFVKRWTDKDTDEAGVSDDYYEAEEFILDHTPTTSSQAATLLDIIIGNVMTGLRSDGRDIRALKSVQSLLVNTPDTGIHLTS